MLFWKKRNTPKNESKERVTVDETGKVTIRVRWDAPKTHPPKRVPPAGSSPANAPTRPAKLDNNHTYKGKAIPFWKKRNTPQDAPKEIGYVDETGKITVRVRWDAPKTRPPKIVPTTDSTHTPPTP